MAYTKTIADCDRFFSVSNDLRGRTWDKWDAELRLGAFHQAKREVELAIQRDLADPSSTTLRIRDDYAHFEQTFHLLSRMEFDEVGGVSSLSIGGEKKTKGEPEFRGVGLSQKCREYLGLVSIRMVRG